MPELTDQSTLDFFYGSNPIADEDLSTDEAKTLLVLRANGEDDDPEVIDDINDHRAFRACYMECGDQYEALHLHRFDQSVPQEVFTNAAPPEEWPDDMTPAAVPTDHCARCGDRFYRVFGENDEPIWVDEDGEEGGLEQLGFDHSAFFLNRGSPSNYLCSECQEYVKESDTRLALIDEGIHTVATLRSGFGYDRSEENNDYTPADDLPQDIREEFEQTVRSPPSDKYTIEPNDEIGDTSAQHSAIETLIESPEAVDAGPALVYHDGTSGRVWIDYDNSEAAEQVKRAIEHYVNNEPQGLGELFG